MADHPTGAANGSAADGTVRSGPDGTEIDLNAGHARQLRDAATLCEGWPAGRRRFPSDRQDRAAGRAGGVDSKVATAQGIDVKTAGAAFWNSAGVVVGDGRPRLRAAAEMRPQV
jgi:hypothetical protein